MCQIRTNLAVLEVLSATRFDGLTRLPCIFQPVDQEEAPAEVALHPPAIADAG